MIDPVPNVNLPEVPVAAEERARALANLAVALDEVDRAGYPMDRAIAAAMHMRGVGVEVKLNAVAGASAYRALREYLPVAVGMAAEALAAQRAAPGDPLADVRLAPGQMVGSPRFDAAWLGRVEAMLRRMRLSFVRVDGPGGASLMPAGRGGVADPDGDELLRWERGASTGYFFTTNLDALTDAAGEMEAGVNDRGVWLARLVRA